MAETNRQWILAQRPTGEPTRDDFELRETEKPTPDANEVLVDLAYMSVDPYMRGRMRDAESYAEPWDVGDPMQAGAVGTVEESNHPDFEPGDTVVGNLRWADYVAADGAELSHVRTGDAPVSTALGVLGMPGRTAYFGLYDVGEPTPGDTVVVSGAAGAVGSTVGQLAKLAGCEVIGYAGSDEKVEYLEDDLGYDHGINYKSEDVRDALRDVTDGVDIYYDNVGGPITDAVMDTLNVDARVVVCGQIAHYNDTERPTGPRHFGNLIQTRAKVEGILVRDFAPRFQQATERLAEWVASGDLTYRETVTDGLENAPDAFLGLFEGENIGKQLVKLD
ncbi:NADP-dependent oxidoreductase [Salarchaeum japonicum]|uniref:NADP-dependent oxidoreductase n=1 Tax=Salarchaeum japonicum TaxID=555573 RepID=UPI003C74152F